MSRYSQTMSPYLALEPGDRGAESLDVATEFRERSPKGESALESYGGGYDGTQYTKEKS
jgi:hypothetical protein